MQVRFFPDADAMRAWLRQNHASLDEQWVGYFKKGSGRKSVTWAESVDVALCFGWIDGVRQRIDETSYRIRFTPRRPGSRWSERNLRRMEELLAAGLVEDAGRAAFKARDPAADRHAAAERAAAALPDAYLAKLKADPAVWRFFESSRPSYRKMAAQWVTSAKQEETRLRRLGILIESCARGEWIPPLRWLKKPRAPTR